MGARPRAERQRRGDERPGTDALGQAATLTRRPRLLRLNGGRRHGGAPHHRAPGRAHHHPALHGNAISHTKNSSLASVITVPELMLTEHMIYSSTYRAIEILTVTGAIYLVLTSYLSALQMYLERLTAYEQRGLGEGHRRRLCLDAPLPTLPA